MVITLKLDLNFLLNSMFLLIVLLIIYNNYRVYNVDNDQYNVCANNCKLVIQDGKKNVQVNIKLRSSTPVPTLTINEEKQLFSLPIEATCEEKINLALESRTDWYNYREAYKRNDKLVEPLPIESQQLNYCEKSKYYMEGSSLDFITRPLTKSRPLIFDTMLFNTEIQLLLLRMETLYNVVDYFVICEATKTFSYLRDKPMHFMENSQKFHKFQKKILYLPLDFNKDEVKFSNSINEQDDFKREFYSRNQMNLFTLNYSKNDNDIIILSDVDEIPNPYLIRLMRDCDLIQNGQVWQELVNTGFILHQHRYHGDLSCYSDQYQPWWGTRIYSVRNARTFGGQNMRSNTNYITRIQDAGWHLSYVPLGDYTFLRDKFSAFAHANQDIMIKYRGITDGEWAKLVVEGLPGGDYSCKRLGKVDMQSPPAAYAYINEFGPFMSQEQKQFANYIYKIVCKE
jgi:beta-1,4-mannosyl-glycoprotein beta-1,4-N-acetylglucosaminyltransferase